MYCKLVNVIRVNRKKQCCYCGEWCKPTYEFIFNSDKNRKNSPEPLCIFILYSCNKHLKKIHPHYEKVMISVD